MGEITININGQSHILTLNKKEQSGCDKCSLKGMCVSANCVCVNLLVYAHNDKVTEIAPYGGHFESK